MRRFAEIEAVAAKRKGGAAALEELIKDSKPKSKAALAKVPDDRWLSTMTRRVFEAGFNWRVIDTKWDGFEAAFEGFDPRRWRLMSDDDVATLVQDTRIVRHETKIRSVAGNANPVCELADEYGGAGKAFGGWPSDDYIGLLAMLKKRGSRLGGNTGMYFLRFSGVDSFILSRDVVAALVREGVVTKAPTSQRDLQATQDAFNAWMAESKRPMTQVSRILALSVGE